MIIGNGLVARAFSAYGSNDEFLIFASGVSNSKSGLPADYHREKELVTHTIKKYPEKYFIYFSTTSIDDPDLVNSRYVTHKLEMEEVVKKSASHFHIFRLSNLAGFSTNPNTVLNFLNAQIKQERHFELWKNAERNIIDVADVSRLVDYILKNPEGTHKTTNIANVRNYTVPYIVRCIEQLYGKKANVEEKEKGESFTIDLTEMLPVIEKLNIRFGENYLPDLLNKYYS